MSGFGSYGASPPPGGTSGGSYGVQPAANLPVCPRHPDRVSYVSCQRCGRPTCTECQRPATVGVHCVDCVRDAAKTQRTIRTPMGGVARTGQPIITYTIIAICVALELLKYLAPTLYQTVFVELVFAPSFGLTEPYRFVTSTLLHGGIWHVAFNMYALWLVGRELEQLLGRARYLTLYLLSAVGGSVGYLLIAGVDAAPAVGASGGVFGLFAAFAIMLRRFGRDPRQILVVIAINAVLGFVMAGIAWQAHLGGLVVGGAVAAVLAYVPPRRAALQWAACGGIFLLLMAVVAAVYAAG